MFGGRNQAYEAFCCALKGKESGGVILLLLDSEEPVAEDQSGWAHIGSRPTNELKKPDNAHEEHLFLMICTMETWLIADQVNLAQFFGHKFKDAAIKAWPNLESVPKETVDEALATATAECSKQYSKGAMSFEILETTNPTEVRAKCPAAARFLDRLTSHVRVASPH